MAIAPEADPVEVFKFWDSEQRKLRQLGVDLGRSRRG
jgi:hypothetical protein